MNLVLQVAVILILALRFDVVVLVKLACIFLRLPATEVSESSYTTVSFSLLTLTEPRNVRLLPSGLHLQL